MASTWASLELLRKVCGKCSSASLTKYEIKAFNMITLFSLKYFICKMKKEFGFQKLTTIIIQSTNVKSYVDFMCVERPTKIRRE